MNLEDAGADLAEGIANTLANLDESPEAWRGALVLLDSLMGLMAVSVEVIEDEAAPDRDKINAVGLVIITALIAFNGDEQLTKMRELIRLPR